MRVRTQAPPAGKLSRGLQSQCTAWDLALRVYPRISPVYGQLEWGSIEHLAAQQLQLQQIQQQARGNLLQMATPPLSPTATNLQEQQQPRVVAVDPPREDDDVMTDAEISENAAHAREMELRGGRPPKPRRGSRKDKREAATKK